MTTPSGPISFQNIETEFGGSHPITMSEYYGKAVGIPTSGTISMSQFQNKTAFSAFSNTFTTAGSGTVSIPGAYNTVCQHPRNGNPRRILKLRQYDPRPDHHPR